MFWLALWLSSLVLKIKWSVATTPFLPCLRKKIAKWTKVLTRQYFAYFLFLWLLFLIFKIIKKIGIRQCRWYHCSESDWTDKWRQKEQVVSITRYQYRGIDTMAKFCGSSYRNRAMHLPGYQCNYPIPKKLKIFLSVVFNTRNH